MVNLINETLQIAETPVPITGWVVWFQTPFGLCKTLEQAKARIKDLDISPDLCILPVPVALSGDLYEIVTR